MYVRRVKVKSQKYLTTYPSKSYSFSDVNYRDIHLERFWYNVLNWKSYALQIYCLTFVWDPNNKGEKLSNWTIYTIPWWTQNSRDDIQYQAVKRRLWARLTFDTITNDFVSLTSWKIGTVWPDQRETLGSILFQQIGWEILTGNRSENRYSA